VQDGYSVEIDCYCQAALFVLSSLHHIVVIIIIIITFTFIFYGNWRYIND